MSSRPTAATISSLASPVKGHGDLSPPRQRSTPSASAKKIATAETPSSAKRHNVVKPENSVQRAATFGGEHSPQLSERDSIFADHYTPSHHELAVSPSMEVVRAPLPGAASIMAGVHDGRMSLPLLYPANAVQNKEILFESPSLYQQSLPPRAAPKSFSAHRPIQAIHRVTSELLSRPQTSNVMLRGPTMDQLSGSPNAQSQDKQATPLSLTSDVAVEDESDHKTRMDRSSSMRQALRSSARTDRSASRGRMRVEKSIEVSIANAEPVKNARSRKSSHYMGLFQDDGPTARADMQRARLQAGDEAFGSVPASTSRPTSPTSNEPGSDYTTARSTKPSPTPTVEAPPTNQRHVDASYRPEDGAPIPRPPARSGLSSKKSSLPTSPLRPEHDPYFRKQDELKRSQRATLPLLPAKLLQEIREPHTLVPVRPHDTGSADVRAPGDDQRHIKPLPLGMKADKTAVQDQEDGEEHISSIIYKPPPGRPVEEAEDLVSTGQLSLALREELADAQDQEERRSGDSKRSGVHAISSEHIDISIKSKHDERVFHGNYQIPDDEDILDSKSTGLPTIDEFPSPEGFSAPESDFESGDEYGMSSQTDDGEVTPTATPGPRNQAKSRRKSTSALLRGAVELQPYKNQVGGHSQILAFSPRAIAKELNNRENEFYEKIEYRHPELLSFLPKSVSSDSHHVRSISSNQYLGVVNVNFARGPKPLEGAQSTTTRPAAAEAEQGECKATEASPLRESTNVNTNDAVDHPAKAQSQLRTFGHSQHMGEVPQLILDQNRHFLPASLLGLPERPRSADPHHGRRTSEDMHTEGSERNFLPASAEGSRSPSRPPPPEHSSSWGTTSVNETLREQVLREVLQAPRVQHHRRHAPGHSTLPKLRDPASRRRSNLSVETFSDNQRIASDSGALQAHQANGYNNESEAGEAPLDLYSSSASVFEDMSRLERIRTSSTVSSNGSVHSGKPGIRRRHSGMGLRRRPTSVNGRDRGNLEYFEDESYRADGEDEVFAMEGEPDSTSGGSRAQPSSVIQDVTKSGNLDAAADAGQQSVTGDAQARTGEQYPDLPSNPKEARTSAPSGRVELYLVLEDLNAGMGKPCALDLKMGTRQYGVEAKKSKMQSQKQKCRDTTSQQLGVRFCGMNFYDVKRQQWGIEDKYAGRDIKAGREFREALIRFLYDGVSYDSVARHIPAILDKISKLENLIRRLPGYRFYGSSLLLLYDAEPQKSAKAKEAAAKHAAEEAKKRSDEKRKPFKYEPPTIRVKMLDFTNCVSAEDDLPPTTTFPPQHPGDVDRGYLRGLRTLKIYFTRILRDIKEQDHKYRGDRDVSTEDDDSHEDSKRSENHNEAAYEDDCEVST